MSNLPEAQPISGLTVRGRNIDDWRAIAAICRAQRPEFNPFEAPYTADDYVREMLSKPSDANGAFSLVAELNGVLVGEIALKRYTRGRMRHIGEIERFVVDPTTQGKGVGGVLLAALIDVAENWFNLTRLSHVIAVDNAPAINLHRKHGFVIEGKLRDQSYRVGRYVDAYMLARVRDE